MMKATEKALNYVSRGMKTECQVRKYLEGKGCDEREIDEAVTNLKEYRFIDDFSYCREYFIAGFQKKRGEARIRRELSQKGIDRCTADEVLCALREDGLVPDESDQALEVARAVITSYSDGELEELDFKEKQKLRGKIARRLASRGFSQDVAYRTAKELIR